MYLETQKYSVGRNVSAKYAPPLLSAAMGQVYEEHKDDDGFLYIAYSGENTFGDLELLF